MESFIVRIYRREGKKSGNLLGTVETIGLAEKLAFTNRDELWSILDRGEGHVKGVAASEGGPPRGKDSGRARKR